MNDENDKPTREERLAAQLRANLHRRKAQARAIHADADDVPNAALPKPSSER